MCSCIFVNAIQDNFKSSLAFLQERRIHSLFISNLVVKILKKPKDVTALKGGTASFELGLSHNDIPVKWMFNNVELMPSEKCTILYEKKVHKLIINVVDSQDAGEYTAVVGHLYCNASLGIDSTHTSYIS